MHNDPRLSPGTLLKNDRYKIHSYLSRGGFGAVYVAQDMVLNGRFCVIKESFEQTPQARAQFEVEVATLSTLNHHNLVRVTDNFIERNGKMYLVMTYIQGEDLHDMLKRSPHGLPEEWVMRCIEQILDALAYCHSFNPPVIHRDIKPANIRIRQSDGRAILVDFGIAKIAPDSTKTQHVARAYSPVYSPPEQYGTGTDTYSDVYAIGATLYHLLTGQVPPKAIDREYFGVVMSSPRSLKPSISSQTEQLILKAMNLEPEKRYQTAGQMRLALTNEVLPKPGSNNSGGLRKVALIGGLAFVLCILATVPLIWVINTRLASSPTPEPVLVSTSATPTTIIIENSPLPTVVPAPSATPTTTVIENSPLPTLVPAPSATNSSPTSTRYGIVDLKEFDWVHVRDLTRADFPEIARIEQAGSQLVVLGRSFDSTWILVQLNDGREGWMGKEYLFIQELDALPIVTPPFLPETTARITLKTYDWINVRNHPSPSGAVIDEIRDSDTTFSALGLSVNSNWVFVRLQDGRTGWIAQEFVIPERPLEAFPRRAP